MLKEFINKQVAFTMQMKRARQGIRNMYDYSIPLRVKGLLESTAQKPDPAGRAGQTREPDGCDLTLD